MYSCRKSSTMPPPFVASPSSDAQEVKTIKELIAWPGPSGNVSFMSSTSPQNCDYHILNPKDNYSVGEIVEVLLTTRDHRKQPKSYGGDFFRAKLHSRQLEAGVTGSVKDHCNGTYTFTFRLLWEGDVDIYIQLIHSSEAVDILRKLRDTRPHQRDFRGYFQRNGTTDTMQCNVEIQNKPVCEYRDPGTGERWFCVRPKRLPCSALVYHGGGAIINVTNQEEDAFFHSSVTKQIIKPGRIQTLHVLPGNRSLDLNRLPSCTPGLTIPQPSGFYHGGVWTSLVCNSRRFPTASHASACLKGKIVYMFGDSTLRQWWNYLVNFIPTLKSVDLHVPAQSGPLLATDQENGLLMQWRAHGKPLSMTKMMVADTHYMANDIEGIGGGPDVVIAFNLWAHFTSFPVEVYIQRLRRIRRAITELLERSPETTVIIKTANTGHLHGSNWLSHQLDRILRSMFFGMHVAFVDAWETTSCHYLPENLHPKRPITRNQVDMFLSFICPSKEREADTDFIRMKH
ncbi:NXPE family member 3-like [Ambystoma mexicanum]|uniref:NXPE family member 3-like n=1 Tax=Ambystoma mexicanum TaxID=8296 RepID=UPI0037E7F8AE